MNEYEMIDLLERCLFAAERKALDIKMAKSYFFVGEWLMTLIELERLPDLQYVSEHKNDFTRIRKFMGNPPDW